MLRFIFGSDGTGKSASLRDFALENAKSGREVLFIVPEQCSFLTEKFFYGKEKSADIIVSSFERFKRSVFALYGKTAVKSLTTADKNLFMWKAIKECEDILEVFKDGFKNPESVSLLTEFSDMLKSFGATPKDIISAVPDDNSLISKKAKELSYILDSFEAIKGIAFMDEMGSLYEAVSLLREKGNGEEFPKIVIFDEFWYFTGEQREVIKYFLASGAEVYVSVSAPSSENSDRYGVFSLADKTKNLLISLCREAGVEYTTEKVLKTDNKHKTEAMLALAKHYTDRNSFKSDEKITVLECPDGYSEALFAAAKINEMVMNEGYRYGDFAVVVTDKNAFSEAIEDAFSKYNIPFFKDEKSPLSSTLPVSFAVMFLSAANKSDTDLYLGMAKSGFIALSEKEISEIENYAFMWDLKGSDWEKDFSLSPDGFSFREKDEEKNRERLTTLNEIRKKIVLPVKAFKKKAKGESFSQMTRLLYEALWNGYEITKRYDEAFSSDTFSTPEGILIKNKAEQILTSFAGMLGSMHDCLAGSFGSIAEYLSLIKLYASLSEIGSVPQNKDAVKVSEPGRIRAESLKTVFILGANDGFFPKKSEDIGVFNKKEKLFLRGSKFDFIKTEEEKYLEELFTVYKTLMLPEENLFISYSTSSFMGEEQSPSEIINDIKALFGEEVVVSYNDIPRDMFILSEEGAFLEMARVFRENSSYSASLKNYFKAGSRREQLLAMENSSLTACDRIEDKTLLERLYPETIRISATKTEKFHSCRFAYFQRYALHIKPREKAELSANITGTLTHYILEKTVGLIHEGRLNVANLDEVLSGLLKECVDRFFGGTEDKDIRFIRAYKRLEKLLRRLILRMIEEIGESEFVPTDFELPIADSEFVAPLEITSVGGKRVIVEGSIDRVDVYEKNGKKFVRVVDYKSRGKDFNLNEVMEGINMQMLIYLSTITENGKNQYENVYPAGILYMPSEVMEVTKGRNPTKEEKEKAFYKGYRMNGLLLNNEEVLTAMEKGLKGRFIPVQKSGDKIKSKSLSDLEEFGYLKKHIFSTLKTMAGAIIKDDPKIRPVELSGGRRPCDYCDYKEVCGFESNGEVKVIEKLSNDEIFKTLGERYGEKLD